MVEGRDYDSRENVALKLEHRDQEPVLEEEADRYKAFAGTLGFPKVYWYGWHDDYKVIAFELLGPSLEDLFAYCGHRFSLKTALMVMDQLLARLEAIHSKGLLHRDIKPQNCLLGTGCNGNTIYVTDFGLAMEYATDLDELLRTPTRQPRLVGTMRYASIRGHMGQRMYSSPMEGIEMLMFALAQSARDDLESLGYMIIYFMKGKLPWQGLKAKEGEGRACLVMEKKETVSEEELCSGLHRGFVEFMKYLKSLSPGRKPDYLWLRALFRGVAQSEHIKYDNIFDWTELFYLQQAEATNTDNHKLKCIR